MGWHIELAGRELLTGLCALEQRCFPSDPWPEPVMSSFMAGERNMILAAMDGGTLAGYLCFSHVMDEGNIDNIATAPEYRRRGLAGEMLDELLGRCRALGLRYINLEVRESNAPARKLYEKRGFETVGRRRGYYEKPVEDAILMTLELG